MIKCFHISNGSIASSDGEIETRPYYLDYLMTTADTINCFYHLNYSVANLLKMVGITKEQGQTLLDKKQLNFKDFTIKYIPGKFFSLSKGTGYQRPFVSFSDLSQYHGDELWRQNPTENLIGLAKRGAEIANDVYNTLTEIGLHPKTLASPIRAYQTEVLEKMSLPTIDHLPEQAAKYAYECCKGNWLEAHQIGHWDKVYDFDMNCYSGDTEILAYNGWKLISELEIGELVLGFNKDLEECRFQPVESLHCSHYDGEMINVITRKIDLLVTPNHRMLYKNHIRAKASRAFRAVGKHHYSDWLETTADVMPKGNIRMPVSFPINRDDIPISDTHLKLMAWIITEGWHRDCKSHRTYYISQSSVNQEYCDELKGILVDSGMSFRITERQRHHRHNYWLIKGLIEVENRNPYTEYSFRINGNLKLDNETHTIPMWVLHNCSVRQLKVFYYALMKGDGTRTRGNNCFYTKYKELADRMAYLCHLIGFKVSIAEPDKSHVTYQVHIIEDDANQYTKKAHCHDVNHGCVSKVKYNGDVYCPTVEDGYVVVRRNGKSCICGNSAYPSETAALPDIRWGKWIRSNHYQNDAIFSFCKASVGISADVSPIIYQRQDAKHERMNFNLQGEWEDCLTKQQIDFIREKNIGEVTILDGWWWIKDAANDYPIFYDMIQELFEHKSRYSGLPREVVGRVLKGFYGKMLENIDGQMGALFNPVYGAQIECNTRLEVARFIYEHNLKPIHIAVDGVMAAQDVPESALSSKLGGWKKSYESSALVIGAGAVAVKGKQGTGDFSLDYDWLMNEIKTHPEKTEYSMTKPAPVTLVAALQGDNWGKLGDMHEITRSIEVDYDEKRLFAELPNNGGELLARTYQSEPLDIAMVEL